MTITERIKPMLKLLKTIDQIVEESEVFPDKAIVSPIASNFGKSIRVEPFQELGETYYTDKVGYLYSPKWFK